MTEPDGTVSDGCCGTATKYKSACTGNKTCNGRGSCVDNCTPLANESPDSSTCKTTAYSCDDNCGGTRTCYKSACTGSQTCKNGSCVKNDDTICYDVCYADCEDAFDNCVSDRIYRNLHNMTIDDCYDEEQDCRDYCDDTYDERNAGCTKVITVEDEKDFQNYYSLTSKSRGGIILGFF